ncbi:MAG: glycoside hydrolase family 65 protein [Ktedonobacterales bacterium]
MLTDTLTLVGVASSPLARPFKVIIIDWEAAAASEPPADAATFARLSASLLEQGVWISVVTGTGFDLIDREFCRLVETSLRSRLIICSNRGSEVYGFDSSGSSQQIEIDASGTGDALQWIKWIKWIKRELLAPEKIALDDTLIAVDGLGSITGYTGNDETWLDHMEGAVVAYVGPEPDRAPPGALPLGGGTNTLLSLLLDQVCRGYIRAHPSQPDHSGWPELTRLYSWLPELPDRLQPDPERAWRLQTKGYIGALEPSIESRLAIGNGVLGARGTLPEPTSHSHAAVFLAGLFDGIEVTETTTSVESIPALVPLPDDRLFHIQVDGEDIEVGRGTVLSLYRWLDWRSGLLASEWHHSLPKGQTLRVRLCRAISADHRSLALQTVEISPGQSGTLSLAVTPLIPTAKLSTEPMVEGLMAWRTPHSLQWVAEARKEMLRVNGSQLAEQTSTAGRAWTWSAAAGQPATFTQFISYTRQQSHLDTAGDVGSRAVALIQQACSAGGEDLLAGHAARWTERWGYSDVQIDGDDQSQQALRFAVYHLISAADPDDGRVSIGARGLTGEAYLGHVFWDTEIYLLPFYIFTWPEAARALLTYRYHTLPAARAKAARLGYRGALYAWESADTGDEVTPPYVTFPDGHREPVRCGTLEQHISADIAFAIWQYWKATGDTSFLLGAGAEIILETARFWASRAVAEADSTYHIRQVIGPDEYHEGVDDNAYTNEMARWNIERGLEVAGLLARRWRRSWRALSQRIELLPPELEYWRRVARGLWRPRARASHLVEQFAGFFELEPVDLQRLPRQAMPIDMQLGPDRTRRSQVIKQADVVLLLALLWDQFSASEREANFAYYEPRCAHGSSLSPATHALVAARLGHTELALHYVQQTSRIDLDDTVPGAALGVHLGALGGLWQSVVFGFLGLSLVERGLRLSPHLPESWTGLSLPIQWQNRLIRLAVQRPPLTFSATLERGRSLTLYLGKRGLRLHPAETIVFRWDDRRQRWKEVRRGFTV